MPSPLQRLPSAPLPGTGSGAVRFAKKTGGKYDGMSVVKIKGIPMSPIKMNHWVKMVRRMHVDDAIMQCQVSVKRAAVFALNALRQARANATQCGEAPRSFVHNCFP